MVGLLVHALPVCGIGGRPGGDPPPPGEEVIQGRQIDNGRLGDPFELGIERGDVDGGQRRAHSREGPLDLRMRSVVSLDGHDDASCCLSRVISAYVPGVGAVEQRRAVGYLRAASSARRLPITEVLGKGSRA
jgi:hypothetical protein